VASAFSGMHTHICQIFIVKFHSQPGLKAIVLEMHTQPRSLDPQRYEQSH